MRRVFIAIVFISLALIGWGATYIERVDDGFIIALSDGAIDPMGEAKLAFTRATRNCSGLVKQALNSAEIESMKKIVDGPTADEKSLPRAAWTSGGWALLETDFVNREPAIFLLETNSIQFKVISVYGGTAVPFNDIQVIHEHFKKMAPTAPEALINCYEPAGPPFDRASK